MKYKHWDDEDDNYTSFQKVGKKPKIVKQDKKREIKARQKERQKQKESLE